MLTGTSSSLSPCVQAMTSRATGSSRASAAWRRAWPACCPAGTRTPSCPWRETPRPPSCSPPGPRREVQHRDLVLHIHALINTVSSLLASSFFFSSSLHLSPTLMVFSYQFATRKEDECVLLLRRVSLSFTAEASAWLGRLLHQEGSEAAAQQG